MKPSQTVVAHIKIAAIQIHDRRAPVLESVKVTADPLFRHLIHLG